MSTQSFELLSDTSGQLNVVGPAVKADGFYGFSDGLHTISIKLSNFTGRVYIEATLELIPSCNDWFPIMLSSNNPYLEYPLDPHMPTDTLGDTSVDAVVIEGNFVFVRARIDRSYVVPVPVDDQDIANLGSITRILMNF